MTDQRKATGIVREKIDWIEQQLKNGYSREKVWTELCSKHDVNLTFSSFVKTLYRLRAEKRSSKKAPKKPVEAVSGISGKNAQEKLLIASQELRESSERVENKLQQLLNDSNRKNDSLHQTLTQIELSIENSLHRLRQTFFIVGCIVMLMILVDIFLPLLF